MTDIEPNNYLTRDQEPDPKSPAINVLQLFRNYTDSTGIPIASDRSKPEVIKDINWDYQSCPFADSPSRYPNGAPHPIPISGLERKRLGTHYSSTLSILEYVKDGFFNSVEATDLPRESRQLSTRESEVILKGLMFLPHYLVWRANNSFPPDGALPPAVIILSNSSSGSLGGLQAYMDENYANPELYKKPPVVSSVIEASERSRAMIGHKTICTASPDQMHHFISSIVSGATVKGSQVTPSDLLHKSEVANLLRFGEQAYEAREEIERFGQSDTHATQMIEAILRSGENTESIRNHIQTVIFLSQIVINQLQTRQGIINDSLGRRIASPELNFYMFESIGFNIPRLLRHIAAL
jgi:hypothetical protein